MRTHRFDRAPLFGAAALLLLTFAVADAASAAIVGKLEAPTRFASQVSNVQGWAFTTTPGAELIQPFDVLVDGVAIQQVPCCSDRGDVQAAHADAPLQTGFSGVVNWSREALDAAGPVVLSVVLRDTAGGELVLEETLDLYALTSFPFSRSVAFSEVSPLAAGGGFGAPQITGRCDLANVSGPDGDPVAQLTCTRMSAVRGNGANTETCDGEVRFTWSKAQQGFRQSSFCEPVVRWIDNGDGTATDNKTGLMWEMKTGDLAIGRTCGDVDAFESCDDPHHVNNLYQVSNDGSGLHNGSAHTLFLAQLNGGFSANGLTSTGCFAGYCDWRLPTLHELRGIAAPCGEDLACGTIPGERMPWPHYTSTAAPGGKVWAINFFHGANLQVGAHTYAGVRAVRGNVAKQPIADGDPLPLPFPDPELPDFGHGAGE